MKLVNVGAAVLNQTPFDWDGNKQNILEAIDQAKRENISILCLPELCITGYGCEDVFLSSSTYQTAYQVLLEIVPQTKGIIVSVGLPVYFNKSLYNVVALLVDGEIAGLVAKRFLAGDGLHYEPRWFKAWPQGVHEKIEIEGKEYAIGDVFFKCGDVRLGFEICEDAWVADRPGGELAKNGVDFILNPSASHFAFDKIETRKRFVLEGSRAFGVTYLYANLLGNEAGRAIYDGGALIASGGELIAQGPRFGFQDVVLTTAQIDLEKGRMQQAKSASFSSNLGNSPHSKPRGLVSNFKFPELEPKEIKKTAPYGEKSEKREEWKEWEKSDSFKEEEFTRAVSLALFDYLRKTKSKGFVVSLSGGADSTAVSVLIYTMVRIGIQQLGAKEFQKKLSHMTSLDNMTGGEIEIGELMKELLICVYQGTENSSKTTLNAAEKIAKQLKSQFYQFDVQEMVEGYTKMVSKALGRELSWNNEGDDIALQNIQARVRAPGVWMVANLTGKLLLSTSNRSEAAVGYATMDGDTCGGLSPIAGIDKAFLRQWLVWIEKEGPHGMESLPILTVVNRQNPTAELRPEEAKQTDEDDLMPYPVLDAIEKAAIRDKHFPLDVFRKMKAEFSEYDSEQMKLWVIRFFRLWSRNQWKRERYAPSFHLDDENLDPKTWCRFPILSGGFEKELKLISE